MFSMESQERALLLLSHSLSVRPSVIQSRRKEERERTAFHGLRRRWHRRLRRCRRVRSGGLDYYLLNSLFNFYSKPQCWQSGGKEQQQEKGKALFHIATAFLSLGQITADCLAMHYLKVVESVGFARPISSFSWCTKMSSLSLLRQCGCSMPNERKPWQPTAKRLFLSWSLGESASVCGSRGSLWRNKWAVGGGGGGGGGGHASWWSISGRRTAKIELLSPLLIVFLTTTTKPPPGLFSFWSEIQGGKSICGGAAAVLYDYMYSMGKVNAEFFYV